MRSTTPRSWNLAHVAWSWRSTAALVLDVARALLGERCPASRPPTWTRSRVSADDAALGMSRGNA
jgi:hypothetical protein